MNKRQRLAEIAEREARRPFRGTGTGKGWHLRPVMNHFPKCGIEGWDGMWCAGFVYHCVVLAGFDLPNKHPKTTRGTFSGVFGWLEWAKFPENRFYFSARNPTFTPRRGDIVVFDDVFDPGPHDHIGVVLRVRRDRLVTAEGNVGNVSVVHERKRNRKIRGYIRIPNGYAYTEGERDPDSE